MAAVDRVRALVAPIVAAEGVELYDVEHHGGVLRVLVDADDSVEISVIQRISRAVSHVLDEADPVPGRYTLEVSSPGLERPLRSPDHFRSAIGLEVKVKLVPGVESERRLRGLIRSVDADGFELESDGVPSRVDFADVSTARTVFEWGPGPKPGSPKTPTSDPHREATTP